LKNLKEITFFFCVILFIHHTFAADLPRWWKLNSINFQHLTSESGLPHPVVQAISQDTDGFLWVGTQGGLARWDGYQFRNYLANADNPSSLPDSYIQTLHTDKQGRLWIGTNNGGLVRYDKSSDSFVRMPIWNYSENVTAIYSICDDDHGGIWVATVDGLVHIDVDNKIVHFRHSNENQASIPSNALRAVMQDKDGTLWIGTQNGLSYLDKSNGAFVNLPIHDNKRQSIIVRCLEQTSDGRILVGTAGKGTFILDPVTKTASALIEAESKETNLANDMVIFIREIKPGLVWMGTSHGIVMVDMKTLETRRLRYVAGNSGSLSNDINTAVFLDRSGLVWVGSESGLSYYDTHQNAILSIQSDSTDPDVFGHIDVSSLVAMPEGQYWLGLRDNGIDYIDSTSNQIGRVGGDKPVALLKSQQPSIASFSTLLNNQLYLATEHGMYQYDIAAHRYQHLSFPPLNSLTPVNALQVDGTSLLVGAENGLWNIDLGNQNHPHRAQRIAGTEILNNEIVETLAIKNEKFWIGTRTRGLYRYDPTNQQLLHYGLEQHSPLAGAVITSLLFDSLGRLWIGTFGQGIFVNDNPKDNSGLHLKQIGMAQGMPSLLVDTLLEDKMGHVWVCTDDGIASIDSKSFEMHSYKKTTEAGIFPAYWAHSGITTSQGELLFGGSGGVTVIQPEKFNELPYHAPLVVTNIRIGGKPVVVSSLSQPDLPRLKILPDANSLAVEFSSLDYLTPKIIRYAYHLQGYDKGWIETSALQRTASYTNLPPGDYVLQLKGSNRNGLWNDQVLDLPISVLPAWYQTWWFKLAEFILAAIVILILIQIRTRYLRKRQQQLMREVKERTYELSLKHTELSQAYQQLSSAMDSLKTTQQQLVFQEKMASLGTLTAGVAHEINNPVNFAHVGVQLLTSDLESFRLFLHQLAGENADPDVLKSLDQHIDELKNKATVVNDGTTRIRDLVKDLQAFSRLGEAERKVVSIKESLLSTTNLVRVQYEKIATIECHLDADPLIDCWPAQLNQVFMNLIVNACHAIEEKQRKTNSSATGIITIRSKLESEKLVIDVADNGCGIETSVLGKIFEPFFTTKEVGHGTGLGLSISFKIIENHQGTLTATSMAGQGSCFTIKLPISGAAASQR
jgi:signal transduction histidine kinase/ligand-binding sensor domain-containing protein